MRLFIAEKPSLARAIAEGLGNSQKQPGCIICGQDTVTWCFGHMLELAAPDIYNPAWKAWERETLPMIPAAWRLLPRKDAADQLKIIGSLLKQAASVVNAGDPDREGQLLVDEVLEHFNYRGPAQRIWLASLDARSVAKALDTLTDNTQYAPLRNAARARSQADWLVGLNATRAMTILGRDAGREGVLSLGRVQTPTLNLVVTRDREIAAFKPIDYFVLQALFDHPTGQFTATFSPDENQPGLDSVGRLIDGNAATAIMDVARGTSGCISTVIKEQKKAPPLPHCLSSLQKAASSRFGMTAQQVLDTAQKLYEAKLTSYPRTDCRYLPVEQFEDAERILDMLATLPSTEKASSNANSKLKSAAWDTKKVTAHHAIIPTGEIPANLSGSEANLYHMIATAYCLQFYPPFRYESQKICVQLAETLWEARGRLILDAGWTQFEKEDDDDAKEKAVEQNLPAVVQNDAVTCTDVELLKKKTSPPSRFTEGSLIEAMANIHRFVTDASAKATLKENEGIGTEATRAGIIEGLKHRKYIIPSGKALVSTAIAGQVIDLTPLSLKDPVTTAQWESKLEGMAHNKYSLKNFMDDQAQALRQLVKSLLAGQGAIKSDGPVHPCPVCGKPLSKRTGAKGPYWGCFNNAVHPDGKPVFLPDNKGKPGQRQEAPALSEHMCPTCGKPLRLYNRVSKKTGKPFQVFNCAGYPQCKESFFVKNGKPDLVG